MGVVKEKPWWIKVYVDLWGLLRKYLTSAPFIGEKWANSRDSREHSRFRVFDILTVILSVVTSFWYRVRIKRAILGPNPHSGKIKGGENIVFPKLGLAIDFMTSAGPFGTPRRSLVPVKSLETVAIRKYTRNDVIPAVQSLGAVWKAILVTSLRNLGQMASAIVVYCPCPFGHEMAHIIKISNRFPILYLTSSKVILSYLPKFRDSHNPLFQWSKVSKIIDITRSEQKSGTNPICWQSPSFRL